MCTRNKYTYAGVYTSFIDAITLTYERTHVPGVFFFVFLNALSRDRAIQRWINNG